MKTLNLLSLSTIKNSDTFSVYDSIMTGRPKIKKTKECEQKSLKELVESLWKLSIEIQALDGFYFSYTINHISKEFDLLKLSADRQKIINIELKSGMKELKEIERQLVRNRYYLGHISKNVQSFTYVSSTKTLYCLDEDNQLKKSELTELKKVMTEFGEFYSGNIDLLFRAEDYLVSPLNTPRKFLQNDYFLTDQQEKIRNMVLNISAYSDKKHKFISIAGEAGTGKTLLLYDIVRNVGDRGSVCVIHCGILSEGHEYLDKNLHDVVIKSIRDIKQKADISNFQYIFIDEAQRIRKEQFDLIVESVREKGGICLFFHDNNQTLSVKEGNRKICKIINEISDESFELSVKIRTNKELASFIRALFDLRKIDRTYSYNCIDIIYAESMRNACYLVDYYKEKGYTYINYTGTVKKDKYTGFEIFETETNAHKVIGQEFDNVLMIVDQKFSYNQEGRLIAQEHPNPDYLYRKMLFQGVTRTREKLCIIVEENEFVLRKLLEIKAGVKNVD